ncbi:MAG TPA: hypothetical protein VFC00_21005 [Micromonosporaceae bacterium]|nr:hypothetical protein [Micromonosporaceae bacterium]
MAHAAATPAWAARVSIRRARASPDPARFTHLYQLPVVRDAAGGLARAGSGVRRLLHRAAHTNTGRVGPARDAREIDRLTLRYTQVVDDQREEIYALRRAILYGIREPRYTQQILLGLVDGLVSQHCPSTAPPAAWDLPGLYTGLAKLYPTRLDPHELAAQAVNHTIVAAASRQDAEQAYGNRVTELGIDTFAEMERQIGLAVIDKDWRKHVADLADLMRTIQTMDHHTRLRRYQLGATAAFQAMRHTIDREIIQYVFNLEVEVVEVPDTPPMWRPRPGQLKPDRRERMYPANHHHRNRSRNPRPTHFTAGPNVLMALPQQPGPARTVRHICRIPRGRCGSATLPRRARPRR